MSDELRAAAQEILDGEIVQMLADGATIRRMMPESWRALAGDYLAEHPADDEEPVTEEWLRNIGFIREDANPECERETNFLWFDNGRNLCVCWGTEQHAWMAWHDDPAGARPDFGFGSDGGGAPRMIPNRLWPKTRGDVRRLCKALGIKLKEASAATCRNDELRESAEYLVKMWVDASSKTANAAVALARHYLIEHPADDGEPIDKMNTIRLRIAVAVNSKGKAGICLVNPTDKEGEEEAIGWAIEHLDSGGGFEAVHFITADVPLPDPQTIEGKVESK